MGVRAVNLNRDTRLVIGGGVCVAVVLVVALVFIAKATSHTPRVEDELPEPVVEQPVELTPQSWVEARSAPLGPPQILVQAPPAIQPEPQPLTVEMVVEVVPIGKRHMVRGTTNLPAGTLLIVSIEQASPFSQLMGQGLCDVGLDGTFKTEPLGGITGLSDGVYLADVTMPGSRVQPDHVRKIIGQYGEYLRGPVVERRGGGVTVEVVQAFTVGGPGAVDAQRERAEADARLYRGYFGEIEALAGQLEALRPLAADLEKWMVFAPRFTSNLHDLRSRIHRIPEIPSRRMLGTPVDDLYSMFWAISRNLAAEYERDAQAFAESMADLRDYIGEVRDGW